MNKKQRQVEQEALKNLEINMVVNAKMYADLLDKLDYYEDQTKKQGDASMSNIKATIAELDKLESRATIEPWEYVRHDGGAMICGANGYFTAFGGDYCAGYFPEYDKDSRFVIAIRNAYPALRAYIAELQAELDLMHYLWNRQFNNRAKLQAEMQEKEWRPCGEGVKSLLTDQVLAIQKNGEFHIIRLDQIDQWNDCSKDTRKSFMITHWMPLTKPPEERA